RNRENAYSAAFPTLTRLRGLAPRHLRTAILSLLVQMNTTSGAVYYPRAELETQYLKLFRIVHSYASSNR
ncbi:TPA: hypothetical protein ACTY9H_004965, partial [Klebsiella quasipneumoniae subsp. similipneumoniae]